MIWQGNVKYRDAVRMFGSMCHLDSACLPIEVPSQVLLQNINLVPDQDRLFLDMLVAERGEARSIYVHR